MMLVCCTLHVNGKKWTTCLIILQATQTYDLAKIVALCLPNRPIIETELTEFWAPWFANYGRRSGSPSFNTRALLSVCLIEFWVYSCSSVTSAPRPCRAGGRQFVSRWLVFLSISMAFMGFCFVMIRLSWLRSYGRGRSFLVLSCCFRFFMLALLMFLSEPALCISPFIPFL